MSSSAPIAGVTEVLPHRPPFLFLDEIVELGDTHVIARRTVRPEEPQFAGHYPGRPIMPGVLLCETVLQAGAYFMAVRLGLDAGMEGAPVVSRMDSVKFKQMVKPGDHLVVRADHRRSLMGAHMMSGRIDRDGKLVCALDFTVMLIGDGGASR